MSGILVPDRSGKMFPAVAVDIKRRLEEIDPRLGLMIAPSELNGVWAVTWKWGPNDPRRAEVQAGKRSERDAFDILCWLPKDCPPEEAYGFITTRFTQLQGREDVRKLLERVHNFNNKRKAEIAAPTQELTEELIHANRRTLFRDEKGHIPSSLDTQPKSNRDKKDFRDYLEDNARTDL